MKTWQQNVTAFKGGNGAVNDPDQKCTLTKSTSRRLSAR